MIEFESTAIIITAKMAGQPMLGRPMVDVAGKPLVLRAVERAEEAKLGKVFVATSENVVAEAARAGGADALMSAKHLKADGDMAEAIVSLRDKAQNFQQILILPCHLAMADSLPLRLCLAGLMNKGVSVATLASPVAMARLGQVLVDAPLMGEREVAYVRGLKQAGAADEGQPALLHVPIYAWSRGALATFAACQRISAEDASGLELRRALVADQKCAVIKIDIAPLSVDTPQDLEALRRHWKA